MYRRICVIGLGYIGLPTASFLATKGYEVLGVDIAPGVVETINRAEIHIREPDLDILVKSAVQSGRLKAAVEPAAADVFIIAVPTPLRDDKHADLRAVRRGGGGDRAACPPRQSRHSRIDQPGRHHRASASPAGCARTASTSSEVHVAHCPERVLPGRILIELVQNDRIVGGVDEASTAAAAEFYREFVSGEVLETTAATAEMAKLAENTFRDVNIALANELSMICDRLGHRRVRADRAGQPPSAGRHPAARPGRGRALHRRRPVVHRRSGARRRRG